MKFLLVFYLVLPFILCKVANTKDEEGVWKLLHIQLLDIEPPIWRRVIMAEDFTFRDLHYLLQRIMPWHNEHMHLFYVTNPKTGQEDQVGPACPTGFYPDDNIVPEQKRWLSSYIKNTNDSFIYMYDMGDSWEHWIEVENIYNENPNPKGVLVRVIDGARAAPPDTCGGVDGYEHLLEVLKDPNHEEYEEMIEWLESQNYPNWDPEQFDLNEANKGLP